MRASQEKREALLVPALALVVLGLVTGCGSGRPERVPTTSKDAFVVLEAQTQSGQPVGRKDLDHSVSIIRERLTKLGIKALIQLEGPQSRRHPVARSASDWRGSTPAEAAWQARVLRPRARPDRALDQR